MTYMDWSSENISFCSKTIALLAPSTHETMCILALSFVSIHKSLYNVQFKCLNLCKKLLTFLNCFLHLLA